VYAVGCLDEGDSASVGSIRVGTILHEFFPFSSGAVVQTEDVSQHLGQDARECIVVSRVVDGDGPSENAPFRDRVADRYVAACIFDNVGERCAGHRFDSHDLYIRGVESKEV
jgi:hypothetical protein